MFSLLLLNQTDSSRKFFISVHQLLIHFTFIVLNKIVAGITQGQKGWLTQGGIRVIAVEQFIMTNICKHEWINFVCVNNLFAGTAAMAFPQRCQGEIAPFREESCSGNILTLAASGHCSLELVETVITKDIFPVLGLPAPAFVAYVKHFQCRRNDETNCFIPAVCRISVHFFLRFNSIMPFARAGKNNDISLLYLLLYLRLVLFFLHRYLVALSIFYMASTIIR
ncbi:hypothetical protein SG34_032710 [Thalassomonas viridans]|uniref:Uncharacterized protein n=1 Tax=Thalassomonas viridans TaxID=137584 RepID=A0AAE9Z9X2_9GAMM|nr:hypothetical protein [Thalassomonas viridans]WDE08674.1 hypothetical protein SG34_032710 [Thalassomonas viridans]